MQKQRVKRPLEFKVDALVFFLSGKSAKDAFELAGEKHKVPLSGCMTKYASSYMSDDIKNFLIRKYKTGNMEAVQLMNRHPVIFEKLGLKHEDSNSVGE